MPVYDPKEYIQYAIDSIVRQKFPFGDLELIAVDDCLTDNSGASVARNVGTKNSQGELLIFFDSDDLLHEDCVSKCVRVFDEEKDVGFVYTNPSAIRHGVKFPLKKEDILYIKEKPDFGINDFFKGDYNYVGYVKVVRKKSNIQFEESMPYLEDADWIVRLGLNGIKFKHISESLYYWRRGISSLTSRYSKKEGRAFHDKSFRKTK